MSDPFFKGGLTVMQPADGYRFSVDAVLLAGYAERAARVLDLGCGCGIIPLILAWRDPAVQCYGVEIQPELAQLAQRNAERNGLDTRIVILQQDMQELKLVHLGGALPLVVSNPPFYATGHGRRNPDAQRARARHEILITLPGLLATARRMLAKHGRFVLIYPVMRLAELFDSMRHHELEPCHARMVHARPGQPARLALVSGRKQGRTGLVMDAPLYMYQADGAYTDEMQRFFDP